MYGSVDADAKGNESVAAVEGDGCVADSEGDGSTVGHTGVSVRLGTGSYGALRLYPLLFFLLDLAMFTLVILSE